MAGRELLQLMRSARRVEGNAVSGGATPRRPERSHLRSGDRPGCRNRRGRRARLLAILIAVQALPCLQVGLVLTPEPEPKAEP